MPTKVDGVGTDRTRYLFPQGARQIGVTLLNRTKEAYLVQAWVREIDPATGDVRNATTPFFLKQPVQKAMAGGRYGFQVIQTRPVMVADRESVYLLSFKLIPSELRPDTAGENARANVVATYNVKLFYRPEAIKKATVAAAVKLLKFERRGTVLHISNPSPLWLTFSQLEVGGERVGESDLKKMLPPYGSADFTAPAGGRGGTVRWRALDENGEQTPALEQVLP
ncbi:MAG: fimbrial biogenesis chaperone [Serratia bockelmannii]